MTITIEKQLEIYDKLIKQLASIKKVYGMTEEDLAQEFRMVLMKCNQNFNPEKGVAFETYFIGSCNNRVRDLIRDNNRFKRPRIYYALNEPIGEEGEERIDFIEDSNESYTPLLMEHMMNYLEELDFGFITRLYIVEGLSQTEIAERYHLSKSFVSRQHQQNLKLLKKKIEKMMDK